MILLSDGYLANGSEPWRLPDVADLPDISTTFATAPNHTLPNGDETFWPYLRDPDTLARAWALPGTPELMHRIGGLEKEDGSGNVSYDSDNHERMVHIRAAKIAGIADDIPDVLVDGDVDDAEILVIGWGSTWGAIDGAVNRVRDKGRKVARAHLTHLNPFPRNLGDVLSRYPRVLVPEMNLGQLSRLLRAEYLVDAGLGHHDAGRPVHRRRARSRHPRCPRRSPMTDLIPVTTRTASGDRSASDARSGSSTGGAR